jgi:2',3'-cyclic-nucleotide 2'-phosphodiesterase (5'-nucleotidase family)
MKLSTAFLALSGLSTTTAANRMLQILHTSDMESDFQDTNTLEEKINLYSALTSGLYELAKAENASSIHVTAGDNTLPG